MDTRDRLQEVGKNIAKNGKFVDDGKSLLNNYIVAEEVWACTSCNACVQECPVNIDPLSIIVDIRRFLVEQSAAPQELAMMLNNIENNGAPWGFLGIGQVELGEFVINVIVSDNYATF